MNSSNILIFVPTYNERENIPPLFDRIMKLNLQTDILFLDDNSPDGTGMLMDQIAKNHPNVAVIHRTGKLGIGSAHKEGINWAYDHGYKVLVTMDADFTHSPENIADLISKSPDTDIVVGSRYMKENSLDGWNIVRKCLTNTAHVLTRVFLGLTQDSTGAFRLYNLSTIPRSLTSEVRSNGYSFFFESLYVLNRNHFRIAEVPIALPPRTYGNSKMSYREIFRSIRQLFTLYFQSLGKPRTLKADRT